MKKVVASLYADPLHVGHIHYLRAARELGDHLTVIVNTDKQAVRKKGFSFMPERDRLLLVYSLKFVDDAFLALDEDGTVCRSLEFYGPFQVFANGGDRTTPDPVEDEVCRRLGIEQVFGVGGYAKSASSSALVKDAAEKYLRQNR